MFSQKISPKKGDGWCILACSETALLPGRPSSPESRVVKGKVWTKLQDLIELDTVKEPVRSMSETQPFVLEKQLHIDRIGRILGWMTRLIFYEVVF